MAGGVSHRERAPQEGPSPDGAAVSSEVARVVPACQRVGWRVDPGGHVALPWLSPCQGSCEFGALHRRLTPPA